MVISDHFSSIFTLQKKLYCFWDFLAPTQTDIPEKSSNPVSVFLIGGEHCTGITWLRSYISLSTGWRSHITVWEDWKNGTILFHISTPGPSTSHDYVLDKPVFYCPTFLSLIMSLVAVKSCCFIFQINI